MGRIDACVLCQASVLDSLPSSDGYRVCQTCGLIWCILEADVAPAREWDEDYYARPDLFTLHKARKSAMEVIVARLNELFPQRGHLLDVGAGMGILMQTAADEGWEVEGIEPAARAAEWARKSTQKTIHKGLLEDVSLPDHHYDVVTVLDTLRHVPEPQRFLAALQRLVRPGGILLIRESYHQVCQYLYVLRGQFPSARRTGQRRALDAAQGFSPKSLLYALRSLGLEGWIEPSPIFADTGSGEHWLTYVGKRGIDGLSTFVYKSSHQQTIISPNLLAFGRCPGG